MALRDWHRGKIVLLWVVTASAGIAALANEDYDDPFEFLAFIALAISAVLTWRWLSAREGPRGRTEQEEPAISRAREHLVKVALLAMNAIVPPAQAVSHYDTILAMYGQPAVDYVAQSLAQGRFEREFGGRDQLAALDEMSKRLPDPELDALLSKEFRRQRDGLRDSAL